MSCIVYWCSGDAISKEIYEYDILFWICILFAQILVKFGCLSNHDDFLEKTNVHLHYAPYIHKSSAWESLLSYLRKKDASLTKTDAHTTKYTQCVRTKLSFNYSSTFEPCNLYLHICPNHDFNMFLNYHLFHQYATSEWNQM